MLTVQKVYDIINTIAPFDTQESWDNSGLLLGNPNMEVKGIHLALDVTANVIDEALANGANLIISHHPLIFSPMRRLVEGDMDYETRMVCRMIREGMALISAHTNWDAANGGMNDVLAKLLGLQNVTGEGVIRVGDLPKAIDGSTLTAQVQAALGDVVRPMGNTANSYTRVGLCTGGGSDFWAEAYKLGADVFVTGEVKHHHALAMADMGMLALECGHFATENPGMQALADALQIALHGVYYKIPIFVSQAAAYAAL